MSKLSLVFFGSGPVAAQSLRLLAKEFDIEAVVTKPTTLEEMSSIDKKAKIHAVGNKKELDELMAACPFMSKVAVLIDFGIIVSQEVIDYFPKGIINSHFSLLPQWRGADPITFAILSGQTKTGVSLMLINAGMDTGQLIRQQSLPIDAKATTPSLTIQLIELSHKLLAENLPAYLEGSLKARQQPHPDRATYSRKLTKEDGILDFKKSAPVLEREIRAFQEWPKSRTNLAGVDVIITKASVTDNIGPAGLPTVKNKQLIINCAEDALLIEELKPAGKPAMSAQAFLAGYGKNL